MKGKPISREQTVAVLEALGCYEASAILPPPGRESTVVVGRSMMEKCEAALTKLFIPEYDSRGVGAFRGLREAYTVFTGDSEVSGFLRQANISPDLRSCQDFDSSSFSTALGNTMSMYLSKKYKEFPYHEEILISEKKTAKDLRKIHSQQVGYFGELPDIDTETEDYSSLAPYVDTEAQYEIGKKGSVLWVTDSVIINDSIGLIQGMVDRMSRSARVAHAKYVWNFYKSNALCPDGTAWFTAGHGNLGSSALDIIPLITAITALANITEPEPSGEKIGLDLATFNWHLVAPITMWDLAVKTNLSDGSYFAANDLTTKVPNPCQKLFGERSERIITLPFLTDANDWGIIRDKEDVPIVEMSYLYGREVPEFISVWGPKGTNYGLNAASPESTFKADKIGFKIRHEYGGALVGYQGGYKSIVAP